MKAAKKKKVKVKKKIGRPSKFNKINQEQFKQLVISGWIDTQIASFFGINVVTLHRWKIKYKDFCNSLKEWKKEADEHVEKSLYARATGYTHPEDKIFCSANGKVTVVKTVRHYPPDPTSNIFWLKNRQPDKWRDKKEVEFVELTKEEIDARVERTRKALTI